MTEFVGPWPQRPGGALLIRHARLLVALSVVGVVGAACGGGSGNRAISERAPAPPTDELVVQVANFDLAVGPEQRLIVGLLTAANEYVSYGTIAMRVTPIERDVTTGPAPRELTGTFLALPGVELPSLLPSRPVVVDAAYGQGVYATRVGFDRPGPWRVEVSVDITGLGSRRAGVAFEVFDRHKIPAVGDPAPKSENLTVSSPDVPKTAVDSRAGDGGEVPDPELHRATIAGAIGAGRPVLVVFATPVYCVSRFCGPVTDMTGELAALYADRADFVHVEIWRDHQQQQINEAAAEWLLRDGDLREPWVFLVGHDGKIAARWDNVATRGEIEPLLQALPSIRR